MLKASADESPVTPSYSIDLPLKSVHLLASTRSSHSIAFNRPHHLHIFPLSNFLGILGEGGADVPVAELPGVESHQSADGKDSDAVTVPTTSKDPLGLDENASNKARLA
ncbi:hypothetical protein DY000_02002161 [Brassica cretica]|uniref:Uncharacterized protein n=1 Tax=Brassica cretica TaxID=69181 RepID=A0ABQ7CHJ3_BRACR|nr:hypothetical protein DY000_02002161 [Brassica cretica]